MTSKSMSESSFAVPFACDPNNTTNSGSTFRKTAFRKDSTKLESRSPTLGDGRDRLSTKLL